jgi:hypothetical protein
VEPAPPQVFLDKKGKKDPRVAAAVQAQAAAEVAAGTHVRILAIDGLQVTVGGRFGCHVCLHGGLCLVSGFVEWSRAVLGWAWLAMRR